MLSLNRTLRSRLSPTVVVKELRIYRKRSEAKQRTQKAHLDLTSPRVSPFNALVLALGTSLCWNRHGLSIQGMAPSNAGSSLCVKPVLDEVPHVRSLTWICIKFYHHVGSVFQIPPFHWVYLRPFIYLFFNVNRMEKPAGLRGQAIHWATHSPRIPVSPSAKGKAENPGVFKIPLFCMLLVSTRSRIRKGKGKGLSCQLLVLCSPSVSPKKSLGTWVLVPSAQTLMPMLKSSKLWLC